MEKQGYCIKSDKIITRIPFDKCVTPRDIPPKGSFLGIHYKIDEEGVLFNLSGKLFASPNNFGSMTIHNEEQITEKIYQRTAIEVDDTYLRYYAPVFTFHAMEDCFLDEDPCYCISEIREVLKTKSDKYEINRYKDTKYQDALVVIPKTKDNTRFLMYHKGKELSKAKNKEYRKGFTREYLDKSNYALRMELQLRNYKKMRDEFGISPFKEPTIHAILNCERNVVADYYEKLIS